MPYQIKYSTSPNLGEQLSSTSTPHLSMTSNRSPRRRLLTLLSRRRIGLQMRLAKEAHQCMQVAYLLAMTHQACWPASN